MKRKASVSHDEATIRELRNNPEFAAEYLGAALEDTDEPSVLLIALRRIAPGSARRHCQGGQGCQASNTEKPVPRLIGSRKSTSFSTPLVAVTKAVGLSNSQSKPYSHKRPWTCLLGMNLRESFQLRQRTDNHGPPQQSTDLHV